MGNQRIHWTSDFATGVPEIDRQHKAIIDFSAEFRDVLENGSGEDSYEGFLEFLDAYIRIHFSYEENCMLVNVCPVGGQNKAEHAVFIKLVEAEAAEFKRLGYDEKRAVALLDKADAWLVSHILRVDVKLRDIISNKDGDGTPS